MDSKKIGVFIAARRKALGLTQAALAEQLHVTDKAISRWERGVGLPDISNLQPLAVALGVSMDQLMQPSACCSNHRRSMRIVVTIVLIAAGVIAYISALFYVPPVTDPLHLLMKAEAIYVVGEEGREYISLSQGATEELAHMLGCAPGGWSVEQLPPYEGMAVYRVGEYRFYFEVDEISTLVFVRLPDAKTISGLEFFRKAQTTGI